MPGPIIFPGFAPSVLWALGPGAGTALAAPASTTWLGVAILAWWGGCALLWAACLRPSCLPLFCSLHTAVFLFVRVRTLSTVAAMRLHGETCDGTMSACLACVAAFAAVNASCAPSGLGATVMRPHSETSDCTMTLASCYVFLKNIIFLMTRVRSGGGLDEDQIPHHDRWGQLRLRLIARGESPEARCHSACFHRCTGKHCHEPLLHVSNQLHLEYCLLFCASAVSSRCRTALTPPPESM